ncbi:MAG: 16S rRNA (cytidine(1402)-2'-O)-methyltransferase [Puniceicoccales bacterium]|jgi:16S rRNA (cytidine1402-2'-O)-methyltransferase|nr:16S rRNA (cytidine(1402)-2'-O)-methyltransferase [Puniceicoccales bacterium]
MNRGKLFVVATPIGNLGDMTFRSVETLKRCTLIACEDTRISSHLLRHFNIDAPLVPYHDRNERGQVNFLLKKIKEGEEIAIICDAGTPTISDPGFRIVRECKKNNIDVVPIPGANAMIAALSASGLPTHCFFFLGFPGHRESARIKILERYAASDGTLICYESCHRLEKFLRDIAHVYGPERVVSICKELTKIHETILTAPVGEILLDVKKTLIVKGEFVVLIAPARYTL